MDNIVKHFADMSSLIHSEDRFPEHGSESFAVIGKEDFWLIEKYIWLFVLLLFKAVLTNI